jgi:hypothetical protein
MLLQTATRTGALADGQQQQEAHAGLDYLLVRPQTTSSPLSLLACGGRCVYAAH